MGDGIIDSILAANREAAEGHPGDLPRAPAKRLAIVTCMDARIDPLRTCGLKIGDAHIVRTAGAAVDESVLAALRLSRDSMGTREAVVIGHTDCAGHPDSTAARHAAADAARKIATALGPEYAAHALLFDVATGRLEPA